MQLRVVFLCLFLCVCVCVSSLLSFLLAVTYQVRLRSLVAPLGHTANTAASLRTPQQGSRQGQACGSLLQSAGREGRRDKRFNSHIVHTQSLSLSSCSRTQQSLPVILRHDWTFQGKVLSHRRRPPRGGYQSSTHHWMSCTYHSLMP